MKREVCKFFSGSFAALGYAHAAYAVATSRGIINEPVFLGRRWGVGFMWSEAAIYTAVAVALGYAGWGTDGREQPRNLHAGESTVIADGARPVPAP
jgi:hypothetical protein